MEKRKNQVVEKLKLLIVEDDEHMLASLQRVLKQRFQTLEARGVADALERLRKELPPAVVLDLGLPDGDGLDFLPQARQVDPDLAVVVVTSRRDTGRAVEAMRRGAANFLTKPVDRQALVGSVERALAERGLRREIVQLRLQASGPYDVSRIIGGSAAILALREEILRVAKMPVNVLVTGETGTGKELVARALHHHGRGGRGPFMAVNCAHLKGALLESEVFGHEQGAFTGAQRRHQGCLERADGGTLFLDEIGDMELEMQGRLLRVLEEGRFTRLGGEAELHVDVRVVAATHRDLSNLILAGRFREDLFYRLNVVAIDVPALRRRPEDIPELVHHFFHKNRELVAPGCSGFGPEALDVLKQYTWPGNVRQLENMVVRAMARVGEDPVPAQVVAQIIMRAAHLGARRRHDPAAQTPGGLPRLRHARKGVDDEALILEAMNANGWYIFDAARALGVHRNTLQRRLIRMGIPHDQIISNRVAFRDA